MINPLETIGLLGGRSEADDDEVAAEAALTGLRMVAAELLLATGAGAALDSLRGRARRGEPVEDAEIFATSRAPRDRASLGTLWAPLLIGPAAAAANLMHALRPSESTRAAARVLNTAAVGVGLAGAAQAVYRGAREGEPPSLAPLALGSAGLLGTLLEREERRLLEDRARLERRASVVERLVPRRRARLDHIVVHV